MNETPMTNERRTLPRELLIAIPAFALLFLAPTFAGTYHTRLLAKFILFGVFAMSLDLIWGYAGILSFGHAAYFGLGAYAVTLILSHATFAGTLLAVLGSAFLPVLVGLFMSFFLIYGKVSGVYFSIITLVVTLIMEQLSVAWYEVSGGLDGFFPVPPLNLFGYPLDADSNSGLLIYFYIVAVAAVVIFAGLYLLSRSRYGLILQAVKNDPQRAQFMGINIATAKAIVFTLSCGIAGLAGGLLGPLEDFISPDLFGLLLSTQVMIWVAVGGRNTLIGPFLGAILLGYLQAFLSGLIVHAWFLIIGIILVVVVIFWPDGLAGALMKKRAGRR
jgi:branched-chain amino acid transport system permease protein